MASAPKDIIDQIVYASQLGLPSSDKSELVSPMNSNTLLGRHEIGRTAVTGEMQSQETWNLRLDTAATAREEGSSAPSSSHLLDDIRLSVKPLETASVALDSVKYRPPREKSLRQERDVSLTTVVAMQALLSQFASPTVRADYVNGKFGSNVNPNLLPKIDLLRWTLMPRWQQGDLAAGSSRNFDASNHIERLLWREDQLMLLEVDSTDTELTYDEWFVALNTIATSRYWNRVPASARCTHILPSSEDESEAE